MSLPRLVVAAPASGHGKTTVATGLMAALRAAGHAVSGHKVGPDYVDPGYHALATGRPGRNLDAHLVGEELLAPLFLHGAAGADVAVVEGVMGLYDGALGRDGFASTAHVAAALDAPVILVVDISHASRSVAAVVAGMASFDARVRIAGVILNKAGSARHAEEVQRSVLALPGLDVPVLGVLSRDDGILAPSRHLGLVPADERSDAAARLDRLAAQIAARVDLAAVMRIASSAPPLAVPPWSPDHSVGTTVAGSPVVAMAGGRAFTFRYAETEELLRAAGCEVVTFDPLTDADLPDGTSALYLGGGFPEVYAAGLSANAPLRGALAAAVAAGVPTVAECAGLLYLCRTVDGSPMVGAIDADAVMTPRLTLRYHRAAAPKVPTLLTRPGETVTGHEFHRTTVSPASAGTQGAAWVLDGVEAGFSLDPAGHGRATVHASYLHTHWAGAPYLATRLASAAAEFTRAVGDGHASRRSWLREPSRVARRAVAGGVRRPAASDVTGDPLDHHGDRDLAPGLVDLAVNVHPGPRPGWLDQALTRAVLDVDRYPDAAAAREAIAARHVRAPEEVLPTAGGAEAFTLVARARTWRRPVVLHPQFTEPEAALRAAGYEVHRVLLDPAAAVDPVLVPDDADLVVVGNPTNPTGVLHPPSALRALARPGRVLVVDEAFMDAVPGEPGTLTGHRLPGLVVVRSLTKTWAIPGIRAGYVVGDAGVVADLARQQPPWSVSAPAAAAMVACSSPEAVAESGHRAEQTAAWRQVLVDGLADLGLEVVGTPATPFVLARGPQGLRAALREEGFAVRRCDTFPGLGDDYLRVAVRDPALTRQFLAALARCRAGSATPAPARES